MEDFAERAVFLAAVCGQTYVQFSNPEGVFVAPAGYAVRYKIEANSVFDKWETFGFIIESDEEIIIAFRGSSTAGDWIANITASQKRYPYVKGAGNTHRGFTDVYASARKGILTALQSLPTGKALFITGHSLGGALATLCAIDIAANTSYTSPHLFTYGSPRVGDQDFAKAYPKYVAHSHRIANPFDAVIHVPPPIYTLPRRETRYYYKHVKTLFPLPFQKGSVTLNHILESYFTELSLMNPAFTQSMCRANPGFCPAVHPPAPAVRVNGP